MVPHSLNVPHKVAPDRSLTKTMNPVGLKLQMLWRFQREKLIETIDARAKSRLSSFRR